jgi:hypothetical protein
MAIGVLLSGVRRLLVSTDERIIGSREPSPPLPGTDLAAHGLHVRAATTLRTTYSQSNSAAISDTSEVSACQAGHVWRWMRERG